jgi:hypothetical protein
MNTEFVKITKEYLESIRYTKLDMKSVFSIIDCVHTDLIHSFDIEYCKLLKDIVINSDNDECFDKLVNLFLEFKDKKDFFCILMECRIKYFDRFFVHLSKLKKIGDCGDKWEEFIIDYLSQI